MKKIQSIPFNEFMQKESKCIANARRIPTTKVYSFISPLVFFDGGTMLIVGAGIVAIGLAAFESHAVKMGDMDKADKISLFGNMLLQGGAIALAIYIFSSMHFLRWLY